MQGAFICSSKNQDKQIRKVGGIGIRRNRRFSFPSNSASGSLAYNLLSEQGQWNQKHKRKNKLITKLICSLLQYRF